MTEPHTTAPGGAAAEETLVGTIRSIVHHNEQTGFLIAKISVDGSTPQGLPQATVTGKCPTAWPGESVRCVGRWKRHPTYGTQFEASSITCLEPTSTDGIERYLAGGLFRGIGPSFAKKIVDHFGEDTLRILEKESARLAEVPGIGKARIRQIRKAYAENEASRETMIFLQGHGITPGTAAKIYKRYGEHAIACVKRNPYQLCADIDGIGFLKADEIARKLGIPKESPYRARAGIHYTLRELAEQGHCFCETQTLLLSTAERLGIAMRIIEDALNDELAQNRLVDDGGRIYLRSLHRAERLVAARLLDIRDAAGNQPPIQAAAAVAWVTPRLSFPLAPQQAQAVSMALTDKLSVITGGPGVGKTTIVRALCLILQAKKREIRLVAPTGRAARRLAESTGHVATTIHRLLKFNPIERQFVHNAENPVSGDAFIIDESSMIDIELAAHLLAAVPTGASLVFVGDVDQLPSVGPGNVLRDIIDSGVVPVTRLDRIFRQKAGSGIVLNAHSVNQGHFFVSPPPGDPPFSDFFFIERTRPEDIIKDALLLIRERIPRKYNLNPLTDIQLLAPMRQNAIGVDHFNELLQAELNPGRGGIRLGAREYRVGDRVMQRRNDYSKEVFNGDIGFVRTVDTATQSLAVDFDGRLVAYDRTDLTDLDLAYATTIHKSQGSEYPAVVILIAFQYYTLLQRNLLYTAITRGRKLVCVIGDPKAVKAAIRTTDPLQRQTALDLRLQCGNRIPQNQLLPEGAE